MPADTATARQDELELEVRLMLRAAQLYYRLHLTQDQVGERLGISRFKVGRLLEIVQLNGAISRSASPTRAQEVVEQFGRTAGAAIRLMAAPAIVGSAELRHALEEDPSVGSTLAAARLARTAVFGMGVLGLDSVHVASGYLGNADVDELAAAGAVGDVLGRFITLEGRIALPSLDERTIGLPLEDLRQKEATVGVAAGPGKGPIGLAALRSGCVHFMVTDEDTAVWALDHA
jgi:deoxyribonucleoside regulator